MEPKWKRIRKAEMEIWRFHKRSFMQVAQNIYTYSIGASDADTETRAVRENGYKATMKRRTLILDMY